MSGYIYHFLEAFGYRHPLHPVLVHLPIGLNIGALLLCVNARIFRRPELERSAYHAIVLTCAFAFLALAVGLMDWQHYYNGAWLKPISMKMGIAFPYTLLLLAAVAIGYRRGPHCMALPPIYTLGFFSVMALGYLGGELTFTGRSPAAELALEQGQSLFEANCSSCHPAGGNRITPSKPIHSSAKLVSLDTFKTHVRNPALASGGESVMPAFSPDTLSDADLPKLYDYIQLYLAKPDCPPPKARQGGEGD